MKPHTGYRLLDTSIFFKFLRNCKPYTLINKIGRLKKGMTWKFFWQGIFNKIDWEVLG